MRISVNKALALDKMLRERASDLKRLRSEVAVKKTSYYGANRETSEETVPQYDVKLLDRKILMLQTAIFELDATVKATNASTMMEVPGNMEELLSPLE
jgi:hypothetical protein